MWANITDELVERNTSIATTVTCTIHNELFLALAMPTGRHENFEHRITKRNFVPNRFDIVDNEIKRK